MKVSASIEIVVQLSGQEAVAGEFETIRPEHILAGILKLSELPVDEIVKAAPGSEAGRLISDEVSALKSEFSARGIDTKQVRRRLRAAQGKGGHPFDGGSLHRSDEAKVLFDSAARIADEAGKDTLTAVNLLEAVLKSPTKIIAEVLGESPNASVPPASNTPLLDKCGVDLTHLAGEGQLPSSEDRQVEAKALLEVLSRAHNNGVLLIFEEWKTARAVAAAAACTIARRTAPKSLQLARMLDISDFLAGARSDIEGLDYKQLIEEAAKANDVVLLVSPVHGGRTNFPEQDQVYALEHVLKSKPFRFILPVAGAAYAATFKNDIWWKQHAHPIWVSERRAKEIPTEL